jgi:hypothetical protein
MSVVLSLMYKGQRHPAEITSHWLYRRFTLSFREVEGAVIPERTGAVKLCCPTAG